jgi:exonuclease III
MNNKIKESSVSKRLDKILVSKTLLIKVVKIKIWVEVGGSSNHLPILLQIDKKIYEANITL